MKYFTDLEEYQDAMSRVDMSLDLNAKKTGGFLMEEIENDCYNKCQRILDCPEMEKAYKFCLDVNFDDLKDEIIQKIDKLHDLAVQRGFIKLGSQEQDVPGMNDELGYDDNMEIGQEDEPEAEFFNGQDATNTPQITNGVSTPVQSQANIDHTDVEGGSDISMDTGVVDTSDQTQVDDMDQEQPETDVSDDETNVETEVDVDAANDSPVSDDEESVDAGNDADVATEVATADDTDQDVGSEEEKNIMQTEDSEDQVVPTEDDVVADGNDDSSEEVQDVDDQAETSVDSEETTEPEETPSEDGELDAETKQIRREEYTNVFKTALNEMFMKMKDELDETDAEEFDGKTVNEMEPEEKAEFWKKVSDNWIDKDDTSLFLTSDELEKLEDQKPDPDLTDDQTGDESNETEEEPSSDENTDAPEETSDEESDDSGDGDSAEGQSDTEDSSETDEEETEEEPAEGA